MMIHEITEKAGAHKKRKRVGRGESSGHGKTSGRGTKGSYSRAGGGPAFGSEGGNLPLFRRLPKRGFNNNYFAQKFSIVNVGDLNRHFTDGQTVDVSTLIEKHLVRDEKLPVKILGDGELTLKLKVVAQKISAQASKKITAVGGSIELLELDRNKSKVDPKTGKFKPRKA
jgi:large subunit ribosomal protein L15